ncbi:hypothetical protein [Flavilitoribacter nigricans]|uniref:Tetratricopeptide repeat protein n=1 Tax=Flavilitoribacter nigricans (strain ATCC 23147 / DSM 23189 / NBRC 102662 / NCIMB 1420 / SS-2) TaxID=1122177 RepID=A0A2D0NDI9_FLAN2|nr:hypothetical protein [Flavilitoribacter nigricans]PHN06249.1 hypothetical protein CRP01_11775 [Flavilitoribacter nigricans DSM 23189 = NBRC 102662]
MLYPYTKFPLFLLFFIGFVLPVAQAQDPNVGFTNSITMAETNKSYGRDIVGRLTEADLLKRKGEWQEALLAIDKALAQQSEWIPGLVARAEILTFMGQNAEAETTLNRARLINERATEVLMSYKLKNPTRFLALFPQAWITERLPLPVAEVLWVDINAPDYDLLELDYFNTQYDQLIYAPDSVGVFDLIRLQLSEDIGDLPQDVDPYLTPETDVSLREMLKGNVELLYRHPNDAIYHYTRAIEQGTESWPELRYNRGLTFIFMNRYAVGCRDLETSADQGFRPALAMLKYLCNF